MYESEGQTVKRYGGWQSGKDFLPWSFVHFARRTMYESEGQTVKGCGGWQSGRDFFPWFFVHLARRTMYELAGQTVKGCALRPVAFFHPPATVGLPLGCPGVPYRPQTGMATFPWCQSLLFLAHLQSVSKQVCFPAMCETMHRHALGQAPC